MLNRSLTTLGFLVVFAAQAAAQVTPPAVLTPTDPNLRLWLKADAGLTLGTQAEGQPGRFQVLINGNSPTFGTRIFAHSSRNPSAHSIDSNPNRVIPKMSIASRCCRMGMAEHLADDD